MTRTPARHLLPPRNRMRLAAACSLLALAGAGGAHAEAPFAFAAAPGKLPKAVVPDAYRIDLTPDLQKLTLAGTEAIDLHVLQAGTDMVLNQAGLALAHASLEDGAQATVTLDEKLQTAKLHFASPVQPGRHTLTIAYTGPIPQTPNGIYYDDYKTASGAQKRMLVTQFEVSDARRMFPGWDEPAFKATFQLTVTLPKDLAVISNMPPASISAAGADRKRVAFATTPRMSTYLLALVAGDLSALHATAAGTSLSAWAPTGTQDQAAYALDVERHVLPYYNEYFGVKYPLPKLDLIAIPGNFEAGAMENWGAITFIDETMLFDPANSSPATRETIHLDVAHEMAHQWSGDLVTMGWWDNIWLNEGFATWMELKATDHFNPDWETWPRQHQLREVAMSQDAAPTTHPIQQPIRDESEANTAFDVISYQKGSQIIRMVEDWLGPDVFRDGMRRYMRAHAYGNATSADLWAALRDASHQDVARFATGFTMQPGIPLVHVAAQESRAGCSVVLTQDRFTIHDPHPRALTWTIPVTLGGPDTTTQRVVLTAEPAHLHFDRCSAIKANFGENGYFRTQYDAPSLAALGRVFSELPSVDRANLLGDEFALFLAGRAKLTEYLDLLPHLSGERDVAVLTDTLSNLQRIDRALAGSAWRPRFDAYAADLVRPEFARLGWDAKPGERFLDARLRPAVVGAMGTFGDQAVLAEARRRFAAFTHDPAALPPALRTPVLTMVGHTADQATYDTLRAMGVRATSTEEKLRYFEAMAGAQDPKLVAQNVRFAEAGELPNGRITGFLEVASRASEQPDQVFALTRQREHEIAKRVPGEALDSTVLASAAIGSSSQQTSQALMAAPSSQASIGAHTFATRAAEAIGTRADLNARTVPAVRAWLEGKK